MSVRLGVQWAGVGPPDMAVAQLAASLLALHWAGRRAGTGASVRGARGRGARGQSEERSGHVDN